ncbi:MAG: agmatine deiminase family protein [Bacteroidaceae bacterium]
MALLAKIPSPPQANLTLELQFGATIKETENKRTSTFPAEWFPQSGVQLTWPHKDTDWADMLNEVTECYVRMAFEISSRETLLIISPEPDEVRALLEQRLPAKATRNILYATCATNDTWARDHAFITVFTDSRTQLLDFGFNGWGHKFEAKLDNAINRQLYDNNQMLKGEYVDKLDFLFEGGSIESDGCGTLLTTSNCLLSSERNPQMNKAEIEEYLKQTLHSERVLWLDYGNLLGDDTDSHIDTLVRFCSATTLAYVKCEDEQDEHFESLHLMEEQLKSFRTSEGEPYTLLPLPLPAAIYDDGARLPATYANFLILNGAVLYPTYAQPELDELARKQLQKAFTKLAVIGIDCQPLIQQHGSLHCCTMQYPMGVLPPSITSEKTI